MQTPEVIGKIILAAKAMAIYCALAVSERAEMRSDAMTVHAMGLTFVAVQARI
jgi:hypothetical protein